MVVTPGVARIVLGLAVAVGDCLVCPFASVKSTVRVKSTPPAFAATSPGLRHLPLPPGAEPDDKNSDGDCYSNLL